MDLFEVLLGLEEDDGTVSVANEEGLGVLAEGEAGCATTRSSVFDGDYLGVKDQIPHLHDHVVRSRHKSESCFKRHESQFDNYATMSSKVVRLEAFLQVIHFDLRVRQAHSDEARGRVNAQL